MTEIIATRAAALTNSIGVNLHLYSPPGSYGNPALVNQDMNYLGVKIARSGANDIVWAAQHGTSPEEATLAANGIKFDFLLDGGGTQAHLNQEIQDIANFASAHPGSVEAIEGPNEINNFPFSYSDSSGSYSGEAAAYHEQADAYATIKTNPTLSKVPVYFYTGYQFDSGFQSPILQTGKPGLYSTPLADFDNQHPYPTNGQNPENTGSRSTAFTNAADPTTIPGVFTEEGYNWQGEYGNSSNVGLDGRYELDMILDGARQGIGAQYLYELMNGYNDGWGLFTADSSGDDTTPTKIAVDVHNLLSILHDGASNAMSFTTGSENVTLKGLPSSGNDMLLEKSGGIFDLVVWNEPGIKNTTSPLKVGVDLGTQFNSVQVFDPTQSTGAINTHNGAETFQVSVGNHPKIIEFHN